MQLAKDFFLKCFQKLYQRNIGKAFVSVWSRSSDVIWNLDRYWHSHQKDRHRGYKILSDFHGTNSCVVIQKKTVFHQWSSFLIDEIFSSGKFNNLRSTYQLDIFLQQF